MAVTKLVEKIESSLSGIRLEDARVIISGEEDLAALKPLVNSRN